MLQENKKEFMDQQQLLAYIEGKLSDREAHQIEVEMEQNPFLRDAIEGLKSEPDQTRLLGTAALLQKQLQRHIHNRKITKRRRPDIHTYLFISFFLIIIMVLIAWWIIKISND